MAFIPRHKTGRVRVKSRVGKNGIVRIVRDSYSNVESSWFDTIRLVKKRDGGCCVECRSTNLLDVHHILPISRGGRSIMSNLITLCDSCHRRRHAHLHKRK